MPSYGRVAGLKIELEIDGSKVTKYTSTAAREVGKLQSSLKDLEKSLKLNPTNTDLIRQKFVLLGQTIEKTREYLARIKNDYERLSTISDPTQKQIDQMNNLQREISDTEQSLRSLSREYDSFGSVGVQKIKAVGDQMNAFGKSLQSWGSGLSSTGMAIERVTAPIQAAFGYGLRETLTFEQGMANVKAVTGATSEEFENLERAAIDASKTTIYTADEAAEALYYMGLAGWESEESIAALPGVLDLAAAGQVDLGHASSIVVDAMTAMGVEVDGTTNGLANASHFTNVLAAAMSNSNTTVELLGESFKYAAQMGGTLDYSIEDVTLALGLMASSGVKGSQAGTGLRMALKNLADESKLAAAEALGFNISMDDGYGKALPLRDVLLQLREEFGGLNLELLDSEGNLKEGEQLWEEYGDTLPATQMEKFRALTELVGVRALPGIMGVINASEKDFNDLANAIDGADQGYVKIYGDILPTTKAIELFGQAAVDADGQLMGTSEAMREIQMSTASGQIQRLKDNFSALAIELGKDVIPYIIEFVQFLSGLIDKFRALDPETKKTILTIAGIAAVIGPILIIIGQLAMGIGGIISLFGSIISGVASIVGVLMKVGSVIAMIVSSVGALPVVIGAVVIGLFAFIATHWEEFCAAMSELWNGLVEFFTGLWEGLVWMFTDVWEKISQFAIDTWNAISEKASEIWDAIVQFFVDTWDSISQTVSDVWNAIVQFFVDTWNSISQTASDVWNAVVGFFSDTWDSISKTASDVWNAIWDFLSGLWDSISGTATDVWTAISGFFTDTWDAINKTVTDVWNGISEFLSGLWEGISSTASEVWASIQKFIEDPIGAVKSFVEETFLAIQKFMEDPIGSAKEFIDEKIQAIKDLFPFSIGKIFKDFKLPSIDVEWKDIAGIVSIPTFSISWHAKAMKNGMLLDGATIFGYQNGQFLGGGEAGKEWVVGHNSLQSMIQSAVGKSEISPDLIYSAVVRGMHDADIAVYMSGKKVSDRISRQANIQADAQRRYFGVR